RSEAFRWLGSLALLLLCVRAGGVVVVTGEVGSLISWLFVPYWIALAATLLPGVVLGGVVALVRWALQRGTGFAILGSVVGTVVGLGLTAWSERTHRSFHGSEVLAGLHLGLSFAFLGAVVGGLFGLPLDRSTVEGIRRASVPSRRVRLL